MADIAVCDNDPVMNGPCLKISIYLSLFDVHVNRSPISGTVGQIVYSPGKFDFAFDKNSDMGNENNLITITSDRAKIMVRQIAGKLVRRISCYCKEGDILKQGDRVGIIELGSRVQIYLPRNVKIKVKVGDKVRGGETTLAVREE